MLFSLLFISMAMVISGLMVIALLYMLNQQSKDRDALSSQVHELEAELTSTKRAVDAYKQAVAIREQDQARMREAQAAESERRRRVYNLRTPGFVYLIRDVDISGFCKIGRARYPENRLHTFEVKLPFETEVLAIIETPDPVALETELHRRFAGCRIRGEWFNLSDSDIEEIKALRGEDQ